MSRLSHSGSSLADRYCPPSPSRLGGGAGRHEQRTEQISRIHEKKRSSLGRARRRGRENPCVNPPPPPHAHPTAAAMGEGVRVVSGAGPCPQAAAADGRARAGAPAAGRWRGRPLRTGSGSSATPTPWPAPAPRRFQGMGCQGAVGCRHGALAVAWRRSSPKATSLREGERGGGSACGRVGRKRTPGPCKLVTPHPTRPEPHPDSAPAAWAVPSSRQDGVRARGGCRPQGPGIGAPRRPVGQGRRGATGGTGPCRVLRWLAITFATPCLGVLGGRVRSGGQRGWSDPPPLQMRGGLGPSPPPPRCDFQPYH